VAKNNLVNFSFFQNTYASFVKTIMGIQEAT